jgi:hypothetical protein
MPDVSMLMYACMLLSTGTFLIAASSIGIEAYNKNQTFKDQKKNNFNFLIFLLVCAILCTLMSFGGMYLGATKAV